MLRLAASFPDQPHVSLGDAITGIDEHNVGLLNFAGSAGPRAPAASKGNRLTGAFPARRPAVSVPGTPSRLEIPRHADGSG